MLEAFVAARTLDFRQAVCGKMSELFEVEEALFEGTYFIRDGA